MQARRDNFTFEAVLITVAVGQAPEDTDLVVEPLPREALCPPREEGAGPALGLVVSELAQGLFGQVGGVESLVGLEQLGEGPADVEREILAVGEQRIALSLSARRRSSLRQMASSASPRWRTI